MLEVAKKVPAGMWALYNALKSNGLEKKIKVKTPQHAGFLTTSFPPSSAECNSTLQGPFSDLLDFLQSTGEAPPASLYTLHLHCTARVRGKAKVLYSTVGPMGAITTGVTVLSTRNCTTIMSKVPGSYSVVPCPL